MYFTLNALIAELERMKETHGGECQVGIEDADTNWSLPIERVYFDGKEQRVLIFAGYNPSPGDDFPERPTEGKSVSMEGVPMGDPHPADLTRNGQCPVCGWPVGHCNVGCTAGETSNAREMLDIPQFLRKGND